MAQDDSKSPSPTLIQSISAHIRNGMSRKAAADALGIPLKRFKDWLVRGQEDLSRYEEGIERVPLEFLSRLSRNASGPYAQLYHACFLAALDQEREMADALDHEMGLVEFRAKAALQPTPPSPTPDLITLISKLIRNGVKKKAAAEKVGITPNKLEQWLLHGQEDLARGHEQSAHAQLYHACQPEPK